MVKSKDETIKQFNQQVNMTADELEHWLASDQSHKAGTGVGLLPSCIKADLSHMRKVVGYNSRHLAQEGHLKETKTKDELANAKSTLSLKNWGHDPLKSLEEERGAIGQRDEADNDVHEDQGKEGSEHTNNLKRKRGVSGDPQSDKGTQRSLEDDVGNQSDEDDEKADTKSSKQRKTSEVAAGGPRRSSRQRKAPSRK